jgi:hypothetical protein
VGGRCDGCWFDRYVDGKSGKERGDLGGGMLSEGCCLAVKEQGTLPEEKD